MPLKLNVGISKKLGLPDYGSLGTTCHVEVELDSALVFDDLEAFQKKVRQAYVACAQAVNDELTRQRGRPPEPDAPSRPTAPIEEGYHTNGQGNGQRHGSNGARASRKQLDYAHQLAGQIQGLGVRRLETLAANLFAKPLADLSSLDASSLIDTLKAIKEGRLDVDTALKGAA